MSLRKAAPGEGPRKGHSHHSYVETMKGTHWLAWIAGPTAWYVCHPSTRTKPCLDEVTGGELVCPWCAAGKIPSVRGYVPLYRCADAKPVLTIVPDDGREALEKLRLHARVSVSRQRDDSAGVAVTAASPPTPLYQTTRADRMRAVDLTGCLLTLWALPVLTDWYRLTQGDSSGGVYCTPPPKTVVAPPVAPVSTDEVGPMDADMAHLANLIGKRSVRADGPPAPNGKPKPR